MDSVDVLINAKDVKDKFVVFLKCLGRGLSPLGSPRYAPDRVINFRPTCDFRSNCTNRLRQSKNLNFEDPGQNNF